MKKLGFGLMRLPVLSTEDNSKVDFELAKKMVDEFMARGFTYFDTAWMYHNFKGEEATKKILTERYPRESYQLATKMHFSFTETAEDMDKIFNKQLEHCGVEYFDYYLLHDLNIHYIDKVKAFDARKWILEKKEQGLVKHIGFSFHDDEDILKDMLDYFPEAEFVQLQLNYIDWESEGIRSKRCYDEVVSRGKKVIVMEPVKGGTLANVPAEAEAVMKAARPDWSVASWALRFAASLPDVMMVLSGMSNEEQVLDNLKTFENFEPLNEEEHKVIDKVIDIISHAVAIPCTGCAYCTTACPIGMPIPKYFSLYNADKQEIEEKKFTSQFEYYGNLIKAFPKASDCAGCRACEMLCPQHIAIADRLVEVAEYFEKD